ncbi:hypothetical protein P7C70_g4143, partial [Phenoliferia sp. Uapishka_3]
MLTSSASSGIFRDARHHYRLLPTPSATPLHNKLSRHAERYHRPEVGLHVFACAIHAMSRFWSIKALSSTLYLLSSSVATIMLSLLAALALAGTALGSPVDGQQFIFDNKASSSSDWTVFKDPIKTVAIIGAGPSGLQAAAALNEHNFTIRLFDRQDSPGGNWYYQDVPCRREAYPDRPLPVAAYTPETPGNSSKLYSDGEDGLTLEDRWREHTGVSPVWDSLHTNSPAVITELTDAPYPKDSPWVISTHQIQRHVRAFASIHTLNSNDRPPSSSSAPITSYATRVELVQKTGNKWTLSLRKLQRESLHVQVSWWTEEFDAVVVATGGYDSPHVPEIRGLQEWSSAVREDGTHPVWHSQAYRKPDSLRNKNVLIVGASVSASEISRDVAPAVNQLYISIRNNTNRAAHFLNRSIRRISEDALKVADIAEFEPLPPNAVGIEGGRVRLLNGTVLTGIDEVILATGYRRSNPFLRDYLAAAVNSSRQSRLAPIISPKGLTSLHWTGHYSAPRPPMTILEESLTDAFFTFAVPDPTLALTSVRPWTLGQHQSLGFARVWAGLARIPNEKRMWEDYRGAEENKALPAFFGTYKSEFIFRQFVHWLNNEAFIHGGRLVDNWPVENREVFTYYAEKEVRNHFMLGFKTDSDKTQLTFHATQWAPGYISSTNFTEAENTPSPPGSRRHKINGEEAFWDEAVSDAVDW